MKILLSGLLFVVCVIGAAADQNVVYTGTVVDATSGQVIAGASIRVQGTTKGTYSRSGGSFRLPLPPGPHTLQVRSLGYGEVTVSIDPSNTNLRIALPVSAIEKGAVTVQGDITADEVIKRAVARVDENAARIRSLERLIYSKMRVDMSNTEIFGEDTEDMDAITETFSRVYEQRQPAPSKKQTVIVQRRQTRNIPAASNLTVFSEDFDFTEDELNLLNVRLVTPLGEDALDEYAYRIVSKRPLGKLIAYELAFEPRSRLFPGFEGTLVIVDGTYQVIEARFAPTQETAFPFLRGLQFEQRYEQIGDSVWVPSYQQIAADVRLKVIAGLADIVFRVQTQAWAQDVKVNEPIPDTVFKATTKKGTTTISASTDGDVAMTSDMPGITVLPDADTARSEYWEQHAFAELSNEERLIYRKQDSLAADSTRTRRRSDDGPRTVGQFPIARIGDVGIGITPVLDYTTVTGVLYGGELEIEGGPIKAQAGAAFGEEETKVGNVGATATLMNSGSTRIDVTGALYSKVATVQKGRDVLQRFSNLNLNNLLYAQYVDFYRRDGFDVGVNATFGRFTIAALGESSRHATMPLTEPVDRETVLPDPGSYEVVHATVSIGQPSLLDNILGSGWPVFGSVTFGAGRETVRGLEFSSLSAVLATRLPTIGIGYHPMQLDLQVEAGITSIITPRQYQYSSLRRYPIFGGTSDLMTIPVNRLGGTEFVAVHAEHNFTDLWWRAIGLPTYNGRGIDLIATGGAATYVQRGTPLVSSYRSTEGWYGEAGFAVSRIPTFISDLFFLRFDARWPVGPVATPMGTFGWSISVSSPLL
jgi:hypothetical protein